MIYQLEVIAGSCFAVGKTADLPGPETVWGGQGAHVAYPATMRLVRECSYSRHHSFSRSSVVKMYMGKKPAILERQCLEKQACLVKPRCGYLQTVASGLSLLEHESQIK